MSKKNNRRDDHWNVNDLRNIIHNPVYVGIGPFPQIIDEATWIAAQEKLLQQDGARAVLSQIRQALETTLGSVPQWMSEPGWLETAAEECELVGAQAYFTKFLNALRSEYA
jgi:hypothetical protein